MAKEVLAIRIDEEYKNVLATMAGNRGLSISEYAERVLLIGLNAIEARSKGLRKVVTITTTKT
jgi:antitoxin component of RelBE/YafQ-DinJ toxin-antitoxin module